MSGSNVPSADDQILFLQRIQRLFDEGEFQATYKFALLLALAELAVERGDDTGEVLDLPMPVVAEKFIELYWRQIAPYASGQFGTQAAVLLQNQGRQVEVVGHLVDLHARCGGSFSAAQHDPTWRQQVGRVASVIRNMPLYRLQIIEGQAVEFLYEHPCPRALVRLKVGVAFNLRRYQALIQQLARAGWVNHVRGNKANQSMLGQADDLETFMFGSDRASLKKVADVLTTIQSGRCFYCETQIAGQVEVDHFIPWSRYPRDMAHNFVLAHRACNNDKRQLLAARQHLDRWLAWLDREGDEVGGRLSELGLVTDVSCSTRVARWAYEQAVSAGSTAWVAQGLREPLLANCLSGFVARGL